MKLHDSGDAKLHITTGRSRTETNWMPEEITVNELYARLQTPVRGTETQEQFFRLPKGQQDALKDIGGFVGGRLSGPRRKAENVVDRCVVTLDFDTIPPYGTDTLLQNVEALNCSYCIYSTRKHRPEAPRLRVIIAADRSMTPDEYELVARMSAARIGMQMADPTTFEPSRLMYWPSCCADSEYLYEADANKPLLGVDTVLQGFSILHGDWHDMTRWPRHPDETKVIQHGKKQVDPAEKGGAIGAFCKLYPFERVAEELIPGIYAETAVEGRYSYTGGSTAGGAIVYDGGMFLYSHHATDPANGQHNMFDLLRIHKFGELDTDALAGTPTPKLPSYKAALDFVQRLPDVQEALAEERRAVAIQEFAPLAAHESSSNGGKVTLPQDLKPSDFSDAGNAKLFCEAFHDDLIFVDALSWLKWNGLCWERDDHAAMSLGVTLSAGMLQDALSKSRTALMAKADAQARFQETGTDADGDAVEVAEKQEKDAQAFLKHAKASRNAPRIRNMIELAKPSLVLRADQLDADPFALNTPAGIVDLRTGELHEHRREAFCSKITEASPGADGAEMWQTFLHTISGGDAEIESFLQQTAGMALIGTVYHEGILLAYGGGRNGKSTFFNALAQVLGDYSGSIDVKNLTTEQGNRGAALATLRGKRLVITGELEEHQRLSIATLKRVASTDKLTVEEKYKSPEDVRQSHTLALFTNHLPRVGSTDSGTWRRLTVIPFNATIPERSEVKNYGETLAKEAGGAILAWAISGAVVFARNDFKLTIPDSVAEATEAYRVREDWLNNFVSERCIREPNARVGARDLYVAYKTWAAELNEYVRRENDFAAAMDAAGFQRIKPKGKNAYLGLRLDLAAELENPYAMRV